MKLSLLATVLAGAVAGVAAAANPTYCTADNCLRAVRATQFGAATMAGRSADCNSYLATTVFPSTTTIYETVATVTVTGTTTTTLFRRAEPSPSSKTIPAYAAPYCMSSARYSSACSCFGATGTITTAPTPTTTVSVTFTVTATTTSVQAVCTAGFSCTNSYVRSCGQSSDATCYCFTTIEGAFVCGENYRRMDGCTKSSDCAAGEVCVQDAGCGYTCIKANTCANLPSPSRLFRRGDYQLIPQDVIDAAKGSN